MLEEPRRHVAVFAAQVWVTVAIREFCTLGAKARRHGRGVGDAGGATGSWRR